MLKSTVPLGCGIGCRVLIRPVLMEGSLLGEVGNLGSLWMAEGSVGGCLGVKLESLCFLNMKYFSSSIFGSSR